MFNVGSKRSAETNKEFEKIFKQIDISGDGKVDCSELISFFLDLCKGKGWIIENEENAFDTDITQEDIR